MASVLIIIPARLRSSRLYEKLLIQIAGKSVLQRTWERACLSERAGRVIIAADDVRILHHVEGFGGEAIMTREEHTTGTHRCAEVAKQFDSYDYFINVQGDEPMIEPQLIDDLIGFILRGSWDIATAAFKLETQKEINDTNVVKVVKSRTGRAMYFSRATIPHVRDLMPGGRLSVMPYWGHVGIYAFQREVLLQLNEIPHSELSNTEKLEQLAWLDADYSIGVMETSYHSRGIDSEEDLLYLKKYLKA